MKELDYGKMGMRIREVRKVKGWSQDDLAKKCGISMSFLGHIERGTRIMSLETFVSICAALDAGADELLWGVAYPSEAMLGLWHPLGEEADAAGRTPGKKADTAGRTSDKKADAAGGMSGKKADAAGGMSDRKETDSYSMYVRIMKSVAEIMNEA